MNWNRGHLLAQVKKEGYTGKPVEADVKAFLATKGVDADKDGITVPGEDGKETSIPFAEMWGKSASFGITAEPAGDPEPEPEPEAEPETKSAKAAKPAPGFGYKAGGLSSQFAIHSGAKDRNYKRYENRIAQKAANPYDRNAAIFDTPEDAEAFSAWARLRLARGLGEEHKHFGADIDSLKRWGQKTGVTFDNNLGGATVPQEFMPNLIWRTEQYGAARKVANVIRMSRDSITAPRKTSIVSMSFTPEAGAITASDNTYDNIDLTAKKATALVKVSSEWLEDSAINVADDYGSSFAEAQAITEDNCLFLGDGSATYGGFRGLNIALPGGSTATSAASGAYLTAAAWSAMTLATFDVAQGSVQNVKNNRCVYVGSRQFYHQVCVRLDKQATQYKDVGASFAAGFNGADASFRGFPFIFAQVMPTASSSNARSCYFGDISSIAMLGDRRDLRIDVSKDRYFDEDVIGIRATARLAVNVHGDGRGSSVGPVACLLGS